MWTYRSPYLPEELTKSYIEKRGKLALSRALSIGRVVGFVASGATIGYGLRDWDSLIKAAVEETVEKAEENAKGRRLNGAAKTAKQRLELADSQDLKKNPTHSLGLAERLAREIGEIDWFRERLGEMFCERRNQEATHDGVERKSQPIRRMISDLRLNRLLTLNYDTQIEQEFERLYRTSKWEESNSLNPTDEATSDFEKLCSGDVELTRSLPARVEHSDGTTRSVLSVSMNSENIGELVNFALQPRQYVGQVFHLHGRCDRPQDMVLTDADYRRTYLRSDEQAQTFEEALSALMSGNDILFVGVGMNEADLLRPLRQFVGRDKSPEFSKRHVFAMMEHTVKIDSEWLHVRTRYNTTKYSKLVSDYKKNHIDQAIGSATNSKGAAQADYAADDRRAVMYRTEYGVYTIYHGNKDLRAIRLAIQLLLAISTKVGAEGKLSRKIDPIRYLAALDATRATLQRVLEKAPPKVSDQVPETLLSAPEIRWLLREVGALQHELSLSKGTPTARKITLPDGSGGPVEKKLKALESEARSRALDLALAEYAEAKDEWWSEWRKKPLSRNAEFRRAYAPDDMISKSLPSVARHKPVYEPVPDDLTQFGAIKELNLLACQVAIEVSETQQKNADPLTDPIASALFDKNDLSYFLGKPTERDFRAVPPRRIVRASMARGYGKGSLLHILQQPIPRSGGGRDRLFVDTLFDPSTADLQVSEDHLENQRYFGSFFLHLSFSMEFASVISALKIFVEQAVCGVLVEDPCTFLHAASSTSPATRGTNFVENLLCELAKGSDSKLYSTFEELKNKTHNERNAAVQDVGEILTKKIWNEQSFKQGAGRAHRLEELRNRLEAYTQVINQLSNRNLRLVIVMSGLDKLCDETGTAYNPMFRALFRLLTGCGTKYQSESDVTTPIDIVLLSGNKEVPLRYLSKEATKQELKQKLARPGLRRATDHYSSYAEYRPIGDDRFLEVWPALPPIAIDERYWTSSICHDLQEILKADPQELKKNFKALELHSRIDQSEISHLCKRSVALHSWVCGAYEIERTRLALDATMQGRACGGDELERSVLSTAYVSAVSKQTVKFVNRMDSAAARGGIAQVLREVLEIHKPELRRWGQELFQSCKNINYDEFRSWPNKNLRITTSVTEEQSHSPEANRMVDLVYLILSHLALFPMPVEARVLYGCDEVYRLLQQICTPNNKIKTDPDTNKTYTNWRDTNRLVRMRLLSQALDYLRRAGLLIAVQAKPLSSAPQEDSSHFVGGRDRTFADIHTRYTIQHQLREFAARHMDLSLPDQGERNFFQVSIYCDQPRDLPAPREDHYELVRQIMHRQIDLVRNTIWTFMQLTRATDLKTLDEADRSLFDHGLRRRMVKLSDSEEMLDAQMPSVHAVPQRIRALYGLLRSGFSIGTISRLTSLEERELDQPYERFRGWLRGVTNAAIGWDHILDGLFYKDSTDGPSRTVDQEKSTRTFNRVADAIEENKNQKVRPSIPEGLKHFKGFARPLYRDEIGWLLNERGVVSLVQGQIFDAIPLFQRALEEMHHDDANGNYDPALHAAVRRVKLNMAIALIDRGHLDRATSLLEGLRLPDDFSSHSGSQISWLSEGYLGLVNHLSGNLDLALTSYNKTIENAQQKEMMRVVGVFAKHRADLLRRLRKFEAARESITLATSSALNCAQRDVLHLAKISQGHIELIDPKGSLSVASVCTLEALQFAQSMGIPRLESEAKCLQAAMMLSQEERMLAGSAAAEAAAIANRNGLRLNKLQALKHYSSALRLRGQNGLAHQILSETRRESERRGYQGLATGLAEEMRLLNHYL